MKNYISAFLVIILAMILGGIIGGGQSKAEAGLFVNIFKTVEYKGHTYILHTSSEHFLHDPDCKCLKKENNNNYQQ